MLDTDLGLEWQLPANKADCMMCLIWCNRVNMCNDDDEAVRQPSHALGIGRAQSNKAQLTAAQPAVPITAPAHGSARSQQQEPDSSAHRAAQHPAEDTCGLAAAQPGNAASTGGAAAQRPARAVGMHQQRVPQQQQHAEADAAVPWTKVCLHQLSIIALVMYPAFVPDRLV